MKRIIILMLAVILAAISLVSCGDKSTVNGDNEASNNNPEESQEEYVLEEGWTYSPEMLIGAWDFQYEMTGEYYGYRFNDDGTIEELYNRMHIPMGFYKCEIDGVHYSPDGEEWDELVMEVKKLTNDELVVDFGGMEYIYKRYDGETKDYMPDGWTYVEGTDEEIGAETSTADSE